jgi:hypothetical protein
MQTNWPVRGAAIREWNEPLIGALLGASTGLLLHVALNRDLRSVVASMRTADLRGVILFLACGVLTISAQICSIWSLRYIEVALSNLITLSTPRPPVAPLPDQAQVGRSVRPS